MDYKFNTACKKAIKRYSCDQEAYTEGSFTKTVNVLQCLNNLATQGLCVCVCARACVCVCARACACVCAYMKLQIVYITNLRSSNKPVLHIIVCIIIFTLQPYFRAVTVCSPGPGSPLCSSCNTCVSCCIFSSAQ